MNISGIIKGFLGDAKPSEPKTLELKTGEVVKGMVVQQLSEQEAILNIGGVQVRAKLETPLKQGEVTMLQVQPETASGQIVLKPLDASGVKIADGSLTDLMKNLGLPDTTSNRQLIQAMHQAGIPLSKENVQAFVKLMAQMPPGTAQEQWMPSAVLAFQKGIPLTPETVNAVRMAVSGPAFHETLQQLEAQLTKLADQEPAISSSTRSMIDTLKQVVASLKEASAPIAAPLSGPAEGEMTGGTAQGAGRPASALLAPSGSVTAPLVADGTAVSSNGNGAAPETAFAGRIAAAASGVQSDAGVAAKAALTGADDQASAAGHPRAAQLQGGAAVQDGEVPGQERPASASAKPAAGQEAPQHASAASAPSAPAPAAASAAPVPAASSAGMAGQAAAAAATAGEQLPGEAQAAPAISGAAAKEKAAETAAGVRPAAAETAVSQDEAAGRSGAPARSGAESSAQRGAGTAEHWIPKLMKAIGVEHEHQLFKLPDLDTPDGPIRLDGMSKDALLLQASSNEQLKPADSLKSVLMQLAQANDIPPAMKESVQQAIQQITGQQLMLNSDKTSMFSHITMFVPLLNGNGEQTAAIHIQSRKGKRGEIDARNCRLVFDLRMSALGDTMVDVKVVDRIVSLHVHNDQPFLQELLESYRDEIAQGIAGIGYQFISLKYSPYPEKLQGAAEAASAQDTGIPGALQAIYGNKPYKGMDVRV